MKPDSFLFLKELKDRYSEVTISDEQVDRILAPVIEAIRAGVFERNTNENS